MNSENAFWLRLFCKIVVVVHLVALFLMPVAFIIAMQNGVQFNPNVAIPIAIAIGVETVSSCAFAFAGFCLADIHSHFRRIK